MTETPCVSTKLLNDPPGGGQAFSASRDILHFSTRNPVSCAANWAPREASPAALTRAGYLRRGGEREGHLRRPGDGLGVGASLPQHGEGAAEEPGCHHVWRSGLVRVRVNDRDPQALA